MTIAAKQARDVAIQQIRAGPASRDEAFRTWQGAAAGSPVLVRDAAGKPSYWLVPVVALDETVGLVRVLLDGVPAASVAVRGRSAITSITAAGARSQVLDKIRAHDGESLGEGLLIHDGPMGREAWRLEVLQGGRPVRWILVTAGGIYERNTRDAPRDESRE